MKAISFVCRDERFSQKSLWRYTRERKHLSKIIRSFRSLSIQKQNEKRISFRFLVYLVTIFISLICFIIPVYANANEIPDTTQNWRYIVPLGEYEHCSILPINGLIKVGRKIGEYRLGSDGPLVYDMAYGLLDREGNPLVDIVFDKIGHPNSDGFMIAEITDELGISRNLVINHLGEILPTPEKADITLFDRSFSAETADELILYVNNTSHTVSKSVLEKVGARFYGEITDNVLGVYSQYFIVGSLSRIYVFDWNGWLIYKTDKYVSSTPNGLVISSDKGKQGFVDFYGREIIPAIYDDLRPTQQPGLFVFKEYTYFGLIDINNPDAYTGLRFSAIMDMDIENRLIYLQGINIEAGLYDFDGNEILPFEYKYLGKADSGLIRFIKSDYIGFADIEGNIVFKEKYDPFFVFDFSDELAGYSTANNSCGFINKKFEAVIQLDHRYVVSELSGFHDGMAAVLFQNEVVFINRKGEIVIAQEPEGQPWLYSTGFLNGLAVVAGHLPVAVNNSILYEQANNNESGVIIYTADSLYE